MLVKGGPCRASFQSVSKWQLVNPEEALAWTGLSPEEIFAGFPPSGFEAEARVLHAMHEHETAPGITHDQAEKQQIKAGAIAAVVIGDVDLTSTTIASGIPLGIAIRPEGGSHAGVSP